MHEGKRRKRLLKYFSSIKCKAFWHIDKLVYRTQTFTSVILWYHKTSKYLLPRFLFASLLQKWIEHQFIIFYYDCLSNTVRKKNCKYTTYQWPMHSIHIGRFWSWIYRMFVFIEDVFRLVIIAQWCQLKVICKVVQRNYRTSKKSAAHDHECRFNHYEKDYINRDTW